MQSSPLTTDQLQANFADLHPNYTRDEAAFEASRCLFCYDAPCTRACPTHIDVPRFIRQILHDNVGGAAKTILDANIFGGSCARACPTEVLCEGACVDNARAGAPIEIGRLQRYATDYAMERNLRFFAPGKDTGRKVAIIGSGPAGLSCAHELRRLGHKVTVFESRDVPGGLNTFGIAAYKITREMSLAEIQPILEMGVDLKLNTPVDAAKVESLLADNDAVFLAIGLGQTQRLKLPGEHMEGVWEALEFIEQLHDKREFEKCTIGRNVIVIGCGNTAIDAATQAIRLGAEKVTIAYRRGEDAKSAYNYEYDLGKSDGVQFEWYVQPMGFVGLNDRVTGATFVRTQLQGEGRKAELVPIADSEFTIECDMVIKALGQTPVDELLSKVQGVERDRGAVRINSETYQTTRRGLFAGGDCTSKGKEIVNAVQDGKMAARSINRHLDSKGK
ncbi:NAD(P)-dependent oxidoreductase [Candidatus Sumerlaeota bacterium]|nr:NAD(P)-dependent oxidoreductase [Candidatus Sumerlaeota bacterium]